MTLLLTSKVSITLQQYVYTLITETDLTVEKYKKKKNTN